MTSPVKKWLFLTQSNQQILNKNLLYGTLLSTTIPFKILLYALVISTRVF